jgi:hypothetical protein
MKWLKICGIAGLLLVLWTIAHYVSLFMLPDINSADYQNYMNISASFLIYSGPLIFLLILIFYTGFILLGKFTKSKILKFSSTGIVSLIILLVAADLIITKSLSSASLFVAQFAQRSILSSIGVNLFALFFETSGGFADVLFVFLILLTLALVVAFSIGLIKIGKDIKFAKITGILSLISLLLPVILVILFGSLTLLNASKKFESK